MNKLRHQRGIALITVILIVVVLVAVVIELNRSSRADIYDSANLSDGIKLSYIAKSGFTAPQPFWPIRRIVTTHCGMIGRKWKPFPSNPESFLTRDTS